MAADYFIKFDGIKGESKDAKHAEEIEVLSWSWGMTNPGAGGTGGGAGAGKVSMQDFHFTTTFSKASPALMLRCANGAHIANALLSARKAGGKGGGDYLTFKFSDVVVSSYQTGGTASGEREVDQLSLNFAKVEVDYKEQKSDGTLGASTGFGFDIKQNKTT
jgi:type VI secretion system secreted protein Hcp